MIEHIVLFQVAPTEGRSAFWNYFNTQSSLPRLRPMEKPTGCGRTTLGAVIQHSLNVLRYAIIVGNGKTLTKSKETIHPQSHAQQTQHFVV